MLGYIRLHCFAKKYLPRLKTTHTFFVTFCCFSANRCFTAVRHFVMPLTITSIFNKAQPVLYSYYSSCLMGWYRFLIGTLLQLLSSATIYCHKCKPSTKIILGI